MAVRWEPLPHAPIGMVLGLLEHLREAPGGREDLYKLGGPLGYELDDLLPVTEAAKRLGLVRIHSGDIELTPEGREVAAAEEPGRKDRIRARVRALPLIAAIREAVDRAEGGRAARADFLRRLEEDYSPSEADRQLNTALDWARYGEVFDYDPDSEEFLASS
ncbi:MAG TPA: AAA-associated domain-containing protein [Vicinamibacteria bacterium]|nr:AAA-associated domain-containing protein [Vicinamibacteria bacterium]